MSFMAEVFGEPKKWLLTEAVVLYDKYYILAFDASEDPKTLNIFTGTDKEIAGICLKSTKIFDDKYGTATGAYAKWGNQLMPVAQKGRFALYLKDSNSAILKGSKVYVVAGTVVIEGVSRASTPCVDLAPAYTALGDAVADSEIATWYTERQLEIGVAAEAKAASASAATDDVRILVDVDIPTVIVHPVET